VSGTYNTTTQVAVVLFDSPLQAGSHSPSVFSCKAAHLWRIPTSVSSSASGVLAFCFTGGPTTAGDWITYTGSTLQGTNGLPVAPFAQFPLTVI